MAGALDFADEPIEADKAAGAARQGTRFRRVVTAGGIDLDGYLVRMQVRRLCADLEPHVLLNLTEGDGLEITDASAGEITIDVPASTMADVPFSPETGWVYDLELVPDGNEDEAFALIAGQFVVKAEVTRELSS